MGFLHGDGKDANYILSMPIQPQRFNQKVKDTVEKLKGTLENLSAQRDAHLAEAIGAGTRAARRESSRHPGGKGSGAKGKGKGKCAASRKGRPNVKGKRSGSGKGRCTAR